MLCAASGATSCPPIRRLSLGDGHRLSRTSGNQSASRDERHLPAVQGRLLLGIINGRGRQTVRTRARYWRRKPTRSPGRYYIRSNRTFTSAVSSARCAGSGSPTTASARLRPLHLVALSSERRRPDHRQPRRGRDDVSIAGADVSAQVVPDEHPRPAELLAAAGSARAHEDQSRPATGGRSAPSDVRQPGHRNRAATSRSLAPSSIHSAAASRIRIRTRQARGRVSRVDPPSDLSCTGIAIRPRIHLTRCQSVLKPITNSTP